MNIYLLLYILEDTCAIYQPKESKNLHEHREISAFSPLFTLCPEEGLFFFQVRIFLGSLLWNDVFFYKTGKKREKISNRVRVISPLQCQPTYSSKGSKRALSQNKQTDSSPPTLHLISAEVSFVLLTDLAPKFFSSIQFKATGSTLQNLVRRD